MELKAKDVNLTTSESALALAKHCPNLSKYAGWQDVILDGVCGLSCVVVLHTACKCHCLSS